MSSAPVQAENQQKIHLAPKIEGKLSNKIFCHSYRPIFIALAILGIVGMVIAAAGLTSFGTHQGWWAGSFSNIEQLHAIILMAAGGSVGALALTASIIGFVKSCTKKLNFNTDDGNTHPLKDILKKNEWTLERQADGRYTLYICRQTGSIIEEIEKDIPPHKCMDKVQRASKMGYTFVQTSPIPWDISTTQGFRNILIHDEVQSDPLKYRCTLVSTDSREISSWITSRQLRVLKRDIPDRLSSGDMDALEQNCSKYDPRKPEDQHYIIADDVICELLKQTAASN